MCLLVGYSPPPPDFRGGVHLFRQPPSSIGSVPSLSGHALRTDGVYRREFAGTGPAVFKVARVTGAAYFPETPWDLFCAPLFFHTHYSIILLILSILLINDNCIALLIVDMCDIPVAISNGTVGMCNIDRHCIGGSTILQVT